MIDNFDQLVARCQASRRRRMIRIGFTVTTIVLFLSASIAAYQTWFTPKVIRTSSTISPKTAPVPPQLKPALSVIEEFNKTSIPPSISKHETPTKQLQSIPTATIPKPIINFPKNEVPTIPPAGSTLFEVNTQISNPIDAYENNPKYETAMIAARDFYAQENFIDAAIWAKKANNMNREAEEAWLLYAKSMQAQGRSNEAIDILELYLNYKESKAAVELIKGWQSP